LDSSFLDFASRQEVEVVAVATQSAYSFGRVEERVGVEAERWMGVEGEWELIL
jgi:hypothetical protein